MEKYNNWKLYFFVSRTIYDDNGDVEIGDSIFEIGSTTKTFTSLLLSRLVLNKTIDLDQPISAYKPEYRRALSCNGKEVTFQLPKDLSDVNIGTVFVISSSRYYHILWILLWYSKTGQERYHYCPHLTIYFLVFH